MKTVMRCEEVFDVLTRGPFPSGNADDQGVDTHLRRCHECRQLAEALRPAVGLFHESIDDDDADLPRYVGAIEQAIRNPIELPDGELLTLPANRAPNRVTAGMLAVSMTGLLAVAMLFVYAMAGGAAKVGATQVATASGDSNAHSGLMSLGIPLSCLPSHAEPIDLQRVRTVRLPLTAAQQQEFACCTRCHFSGGKLAPAARVTEKVALACASCHGKPKATA